jgi:hypothetical protein
MKRCSRTQLLSWIFSIAALIGVRPGMAQQSNELDAADLYIRAAGRISVDCPASSNLEYPAYPPFGADWDHLAQDAWEKNGAARELARKARLSTHANWPAGIAYLNGCRALANELADAALFEHLHGHDGSACEFVRDGLHLAKLVGEKTPEKSVRPLVAAGINAAMVYRLIVIDSTIKLNADPKNTTDLQVSVAHELIDELLDQKRPEDESTRLELTGKQMPDPSKEASRALETFRRCNGELTFAAMSLASHIFLLEKHRWPEMLDELVPAYMPRIPIDPWGNGKQTFGYTLVAGGLPDGADRPMIYSRAWSPDGLFYRTDQPEYGFYVGDSSNQSQAQQKHGGQFRDVAAWIPVPGPKKTATTQPLEN